MPAATLAPSAAAPGLSTDQTIALWAAIGGGVSALVGLLTAVLALLIFLEARRIRRVEWASASGRNWQEFNQLVLEGDRHERWGELIAGKLPWERVTQRDRMLIYSFLNVLLFEFNARSHGLLDAGYAEKSIGQNIIYLRHIWPGLLSHLTEDGWPGDFLAAADRAVRTALSPPPGA